MTNVIQDTKGPVLTHEMVPTMAKEPATKATISVEEDFTKLVQTSEGEFVQTEQDIGGEPMSADVGGSPI